MVCTNACFPCTVLMVPDPLLGPERFLCPLTQESGWGSYNDERVCFRTLNDKKKTHCPKHASPPQTLATNEQAHPHHVLQHLTLAATTCKPNVCCCTVQRLLLLNASKCYLRWLMCWILNCLCRGAHVVPLPLIQLTCHVIAKATKTTPTLYVWLKGEKD